MCWRAAHLTQGIDNLQLALVSRDSSTLKRGHGRHERHAHIDIPVLKPVDQQDPLGPHAFEPRLGDIDARLSAPDRAPCFSPQDDSTNRRSSTGTGQTQTSILVATMAFGYHPEPTAWAEQQGHITLALLALLDADPWPTRACADRSRRNRFPRLASRSLASTVRPNCRSCRSLPIVDPDQEVDVIELPRLPPAAAAGARS